MIIKRIDKRRKENKIYFLIRNIIKNINSSYDICGDRSHFIKMLDENDKFIEEYSLYEVLLKNIKEKFPNLSFNIEHRISPKYPKEILFDGYGIVEK